MPLLFSAGCKYVKLYSPCGTVAKLWLNSEIATKAIAVIALTDRQHRLQANSFTIGN
jgi:hypothetical protein